MVAAVTEQLIALATSFGAPGLLIAFMVWDRRENARLAEKRIAADIAMAQAMTLIAERVGGLHAR